MKIAFLFLFLCLFDYLSADLTIRSEMDLSERGGSPMQVTSRFTSGKMRSDMQTEAGPVSSIMLLNEKKMIILMAAQKMYIVQDLKTNSTKTKEEESLPKIERTGKKETISGYECEQVLFKHNEDSVQEFWFSAKAPEIGEYASAFEAMEGQYTSKKSFSWLKFMLENKDLKTYPIRMISYGKDGKIETKMTVLSFESTTHSPDLFLPPPDYREQKIPSFGGGEMDKMREMQEKMKKSGGKGPTPEEIEAMQDWAKKIQGPQTPEE